MKIFRKIFTPFITSSCRRIACQTEVNFRIKRASSSNSREHECTAGKETEEHKWITGLRWEISHSSPEERDKKRRARYGI